MKEEEKELLEFNDIRLLHERFQSIPSIDPDRSKIQMPVLKVREYDDLWSRALRSASEGQEDSIMRIRAEIACSDFADVSKKWWDFVLSFALGAPPEELEQYEEESKSPLDKVDPSCIYTAVGQLAVPAANWEKKRRRMKREEEEKELERLQAQAGERYKEKGSAQRSLQAYRKSTGGTE